MYRVERERESPNYPANTILTYFINSESLSILPLSESKNVSMLKYLEIILECRKQIGNSKISYLFS